MPFGQPAPPDHAPHDRWTALVRAPPMMADTFCPAAVFAAIDTMLLRSPCWVGSARRIASASYLAASANRPSSARLMIRQPRSQTDGGLPESEGLVDPVGRRRSEVAGGQFNHTIILSPGEVHLHEKAVGDNAGSQVVEATGDLFSCPQSRRRSTNALRNTTIPVRVSDQNHWQRRVYIENGKVENGKR
jgi:hypothetical protein